MPRRDDSSTHAGSSSQTSSSRGTPQKRPLKRRREPSSPPEPPTHYPDEEGGPPPTQELDELLVSFRTEVVGIQYYQGLVGRGERVMLRREPNNAYDTNAVQVLNASGVQVGHLPRGVAARLAYLMDLRSITVEGTMLGQNLDRLKRYKLPMELGIYARPSLHAVLEPELEWATPEEKGFEYMRMIEARRAGKTPSARGDADTQRILEGLTKVSKDESAAGSVMAALTANIDVAHLPVHPSPPSVASGDLTTDLLPHQSQALQWLIDHENPVLPKKPSDPAVQFWKRQQADARTRGAQDYWLNVATQTPVAQAPVLGRGGILADGMGLGKTLTILALILATRKEKVSEGFTRTNLIVCPAGVMSNWEKQIRDHVVDGKLKYYVYHGTKKGLGPKELAKYDVVLTTYGTITEAYGNDSDVISQKRELKRMKWKRVIADEGHVMKNPKTKMHEAFVSLQAERRWVCTGTPIVNGPSDLGSLLQCVGVCSPLDQPEFFRSLVLRPLKRGSTEASHLLQAIVAQALLHRTKNTKDKDGNSILALPPIEYYQVPVTLDATTRAIYNELYEQSLRYFRKSLEGEGDTQPGIVLSLLTRMRQLCLSADLVPKWQLDDLRNSSGRGEASATGDAIARPDAVSIQSLTSAERDTLIQKLRQAIADQEECPVCFDILNDPRITDCGHSFCLACIAEVIRLQAACPMERHGITRSSLLELPPDDDDEFEEVQVTPPSRSAKIVELVRYLKAFDGSDKTLVFSQFTTFLDRVAGVLGEEGISFCRFDGSMTLVQRRKVIEQFQAPVTVSKPVPVVMLISLKSGGVGLNLSAANNVFLCDPWWQSAIEAQAVDRAHRMGQQRTVRVFQLIAEDTVEARVLEIQKRKDKMVAKAFEKTGTEPTRAAKKKARFEELKELFGVGE